jgi:hypothetical protein
MLGEEGWFAGAGEGEEVLRWRLGTEVKRQGGERRAGRVFRAHSSGKLLELTVRQVFTVEYRHTENLTTQHSTCIMAEFSSDRATSGAAERY